ncbi:MAG: YfaZ family outer membrane protein [Symbiopectobacterium sp.]
MSTILKDKYNEKIAIALAGSLLLTKATAQAISRFGEASDDHAGASAGFGLGVSDLGTNVSYSHGKDNNDVYGFGLGYTLPLGAASLTVTVGGKALYLNQQHATDGYGVALGGGLRFPINRYFSLYGVCASRVLQPYRLLFRSLEVKGGVRWQVLRPLNLDLGYRYINISSNSGRSDNKVADTFYLGAGFHF